MSEIEISFDRSRIDLPRISALLKASYWGEGRSDEGHRRAFGNSLCVGAFAGPEQVGFARVVTDYAYFAYLCDVIVDQERRGLGIGKRLVQALLEHPDVAGVQSWTLRTSDAHGLYARFGFEVQSDGKVMRLARPPLERA